MRRARDEAITKLYSALASTRLDGIETNVDYVMSILAGESFKKGGVTTRYLSTFVFRPRTIDVVEPGTHTTIQDYPGRIGYWESAFRHPGRWTIWHCDWRTVSSAIMKALPPWNALSRVLN